MTAGEVTSVLPAGQNLLLLGLGSGGVRVLRSGAEEGFEGQATRTRGWQGHCADEGAMTCVTMTHAASGLRGGEPGYCYVRGDHSVGRRALQGTLSTRVRIWGECNDSPTALKKVVVGKY